MGRLDSNLPSVASRQHSPDGVRPHVVESALSSAVNTPEASAADGAILRLLHNALKQRSFHASATALCTELALLTGAARVTLGWLNKERCQPVALSHSGSIELATEQSDLLSAAMLEAIDQQCALQYPAPRDGAIARYIVRSQQVLARSYGGAALTVPLADHREAIGALVFEFAAIDPLAADTTRLAYHGAQAAAPVLALLHQRDQPWYRRIVVSRARSAPAQRHRSTLSGGRMTAIAGALLLLVAAFVPIEHTVSAPARIEGEVQRIVASPTKGYLKAVQVRPGDTVKAGQALAELGERDLELERNKLKSEVAQHEGAAAAALAKADRTAMAIAQSKADEARAQLDLIDHQLEQIKLLAPIDGVVIQGDLAQSIGAPVDRGQTLFTIAPVNRYRVIVELGERDVRAARIDQHGELSLSALPWDTMDLVIKRIAPMANVVEGRNVFELEALLTAPVRDIRPGLRGTAHLANGQRSLLAIWGGRLLDNIRRWSWRWTP